MKKIVLLLFLQGPLISADAPNLSSRHFVQLYDLSFLVTHWNIFSVINRMQLWQLFNDAPDYMKEYWLPEIYKTNQTIIIPK